MLTFILGGARSGKSRRAQMLAEALPGPHIFIATAQAFDDEMTERIARHRQDRDHRWQTVEAPIRLADAVRAHATGDNVLVIDCLTLWLTNTLLADADVDAAIDDLIGALSGATGQTFLVSNEVGLGIVPDNALSRTFRDYAGRLHQQLAAVAGRLELMVAGLPLRVK